MFRIKICGVTREQDALGASEAGADAVGVNFYEKSPRRATVEQARRISDALPRHTKLVGVFVNASQEEILRTVSEAGLDMVQLHGDEQVDFLLGLPPELPVIRAARVGEEGLGPIGQSLQEAASLGRSPQALLLDAMSNKGYGGTGVRLDWAELSRERVLLGDTPMILAGGLNGQNVAEAVLLAKPDGVDTASGVEDQPGVKNPGKMASFVANARKALEGL